MPETQGSVGPKVPDGRLGHTAHLRKGRRGPGSPEYEFDVVHSLEYDTVFMDFRGKTMEVDMVGSAGVLQSEKSGTVVDFVKIAAPTALRPSHIKADMTGTDSATALVGLAQFLPEQNCFLEVAFDVELITNLGLAIGFVDVVPSSQALAWVGVDTAALHANIGEAALMVIDTAETDDNLVLLTEKGGTVTKVLSGPLASPLAAPLGIPTAAIEVIYRVELRDANAYAYVNGNLVAQSARDASAATGTLLCPFIQFNAIGATDKEVHIDYVYMGQERHTLLI